MTKLDYQPRDYETRRQERRRPDWKELIAWVACCTSGAFAGAAMGIIALWGWVPPDGAFSHVPCCGLIGGAVTVVAALPMLLYDYRFATWYKMFIGALFAFALTASATFLVVSVLYGG